MKAYKTINNIDKLELIDYEENFKHQTKYVVDDSNFIPISEALKQMNRIPEPDGKTIEACYDFPDGKDDGRPIPINRSHGFADITELSTEIMQAQESVKEKLSDIKKQVLRQQELENIKNSVNSNKEST